MSLDPVFLDSTHLSSRTHHLLSDRLTYKKTYPQFLSEASFLLLTHICDDILPQSSLLPKEQKIDLAFLIDQGLHGARDGWRFSELPTDQKAWERGLNTIQAYAHAYYDQSYDDLTLEKRGYLLDQIHDGLMPDVIPEASLTPKQMALWSMDLRADILSHFLSHPIVQDNLKISASLTGGDHSLQGFKSFNSEHRKPSDL